ncbi:unnamed protein product [Knipowitschia caucasica]
MTRQLTSRDKQENLELKGSELQQTKLVIYLSLESMAMSSDQCDSVFLSVDSLLNDALQMQRQCRDRSDQLSQKAIELQNESATLRETSENAQLDMAHIRHQLAELMETKSKFEARERQAQKLRKHL